MPVNVRGVVFGSSAAFLLLVLAVVVMSSRRRCRSHASCDPSLPVTLASPTTAAVPPARLLSFVHSPHTPPLQLHEGGGKNSIVGEPFSRSVLTVAAAAIRPPIPRRKRMMPPADEDAEFYATQYDSGSRPPKKTSDRTDNDGRSASGEILLLKAPVNSVGCEVSSLERNETDFCDVCELYRSSMGIH